MLRKISVAELKMEAFTSHNKKDNEENEGITKAALKK